MRAGRYSGCGRAFPEYENHCPAKAYSGGVEPLSRRVSSHCVSAFHAAALPFKK